MLKAVCSASLSIMRIRTFMLGRTVCSATLSIADKMLGRRKVQMQTVSSIASDCVAFSMLCGRLVCSTSAAQTERNALLRPRVSPVRAYPIYCQYGGKVGRLIGSTNPMSPDRKARQDIHWLVHVCRGGSASDL